MAKTLAMEAKKVFRLLAKTLVRLFLFWIGCLLVCLGAMADPEVV